MNELSPLRMTAEEFLEWYKDQPGRFELLNGRPVQMMSPERIQHVRTKTAAYQALAAAIKDRELDCEAVPDGIGVRIGDEISFEPDVTVYCGPRLAENEIYAPNPVIVVEVLSPGTRSVDATTKLEHYFKLDSIQHYLIIDADNRTIVHHRRTEGCDLATSILADASLRLDPPGITVEIADLLPVE